jgi:hypothetical protein
MAFNVSIFLYILIIESLVKLGWMGESRTPVGSRTRYVSITPGLFPGEFRKSRVFVKAEPLAPGNFEMIGALGLLAERKRIDDLNIFAQRF